MSSCEFPLVEEVPWPDWEALLGLLSRLPFFLFLDSPEGAAEDSSLARYSFLMADPPEFLLVPGTATGAQARAAFENLQQQLRELHQPARPDLPPFQGGLAGFWSYEFNRAFEDVPPARIDDCRWPLCALGFYDVLLAADNASRRAWLISQGLPCPPGEDRRERAQYRLALFQKLLTAASNDRDACEGALHLFEMGIKKWTSQVVPTAGSRVSEAGFGRDGIEEVLQHQTLIEPGAGSRRLPLTSNFSREEYLGMVRRAVEYIRAGDVFQVNLAQRLGTPAPADPMTLYATLRRVNPAPFAAYFDFGHAQLLSASPERFLRVRGRHVETRPIKGTRARAGTAEDARVASELLTAAKDRAENIMITDLLRNDLSRVCLPESVRVTSLCRLEKYAAVFHLVSVIEGELARDHDVFDLLAACFPGGSVTGAPKPRAMEIIAELELHVRGPYCGSLGYIGWDGSADWNILIRTILHWQNWYIFSVGGGIVARSDPQAEYEETWHKAARLLQAIELASRPGSR